MLGERKKIKMVRKRRKKIGRKKFEEKVRKKKGGRWWDGIEGKCKEENIIEERKEEKEFVKFCYNFIRRKENKFKRKISEKNWRKKMKKLKEK